jgi:hypothetical protein
MSFEKIADVFDVECTPVESTSSAVAVIPAVSESPEDEDFDYSRATQYELIEQGKHAINTAMLIMNETQSPRAIEVLASLLKNVSELNRSLVQMSSDKADVKMKKKGVPAQGGSSQPVTQNVQNNIIFSGSSADLNKRIAELMKANS